jgi:nucleotide-binding universal stress UspA family protein
MRIVVGFLRSAEGQAALERAIDEAQRSDGELLVVHSMRGGTRDELNEVMTYREEFDRVTERLDAAGVKYRIVEYARGHSPAKDLVDAAAEHDADLIVIGVRRRSPVGKLVLGSNAQEVILQAECAVLAVKPTADKHE